MAPSRPDELPADERAGQDLDSVLASYLKAIDQGVSRESLRGDFLRRYPQHASTLREFFADGDELERYFGAMQESGPPIASPAKGVELGPSAAIVGAHLGDYEILEEIDRGGMGVVFKARQESLDRIVALKVIAAGWLASATEVERFRREAITAARLDHPGIVPVYEVGESEGHRFIAMKHIEGRGLDRHLARFTGRYRECALIVESLAHALEHAHSSGVLHRDIKPSNILLDGAGNPLLADFGLAKASGETSLTVSCAMAGTLRYLAPELLSSSNDNGAAHSARSDLYSLGCVLYELIVGRAAFPADSTGELLHQILSDDPLRPSLLDRRVPRDLETICLKCLEKSPSRRY
ncbi:MAG TPA: serine/threonine-protein kinase, partial [Planctomycetota bacterium]|nr:serine/threonine-protein kinase [Planctomycetota bacterium]